MGEILRPADCRAQDDGCLPGTAFGCARDDGAEHEHLETGIVPRPREVYSWGEIVTLSSPALGWTGASKAETEELERLAEEKGLEPAGETPSPGDAGDSPAGEGGDKGDSSRPIEGGLWVVFHEIGEWGILETECSLETGGIPGAYYLEVVAGDGASGDGASGGGSGDGGGASGDGGSGGGSGDGGGASGDGASGSSDVVAHVYAPDEDGRFYALKTLRQMVTGAVGDSPAGIRLGALFDRPAIRLRGVLEGFYGDPWGDEDRLGMLREAANLKLNNFVYAPKGDAAINIGWMVPFSAEDISRMKALVKEAKKNRMQLCYELHPGWLLHYSSDEDLAKIAAKFDIMVENGVACLILALDDVSRALVPPDPDYFSDYTSAQAAFVPKLGKAILAKHPGVSLVFVPSEYFTNHPGAAAALPVLGVALPQEWGVAWTGTEVLPETISLADAQAVEAMLKRKVMLGDNYPVSDGAQDTGTIHLGPLTGRAPDLLPGLAGIAFNIMPLPYASLPALATGADYSWNPEAYDPAESLTSVCALYGGAGGKDALCTLATVNRSKTLAGSEAPELSAATAAFWDAWDAAAADGGKSLESEFFVSFLSAASGLASSDVHPKIAAEILPWGEKLTAYGEAGILALSLLKAQAAGDPVASKDAEALALMVEALLSPGPRPTGPIMDEFLARALSELPAN